MPRKKLKKKLKRRKSYDKMSSVEKLSHQALIAMMKANKRSAILD